MQTPFGGMVLLAAAVIMCGEVVAAAPAQYVEVSAEAGIDFCYVNGAAGKQYMPEPMGSGGAFFDYDGDGLPEPR